MKVRKQIEDKIVNTQVQEIDWIINDTVKELQLANSDELANLDKQLLFESVIESRNVYKELPEFSKREIDWIVNEALDYV